MGAILHYFSKQYRTILIVLGIRMVIFSKPVSPVCFLNMLENSLTCTVSKSTEFTKHFLTIYMISIDPMSLKNWLCSGIERTNRARIIVNFIYMHWDISCAILFEITMITLVFKRRLVQFTFSTFCFRFGFFSLFHQLLSLSLDLFSLFLQDFSFS